LLRQFQADISSATATLRQPQLSGPPSFAKTQIAHYKTTVPILRTVTKPNAALITHPSSLFETERSGHAPARNPHRPTPPPAQTPAVSSLEAFRTPASAHPLAPVPGRRPKTLNGSGFVSTNTKNQGVREEFEALRRARRERNGANFHLIRSDKAC
jgi:hypothetical protein